MADAWTQLTDPPEGVDHAALAYLDGKLCCRGFRKLASTQLIVAYDIKADVWSDAPPLPTPRGALTHVVSGRPEARAAFSSVHEVLIPDPGDR